VGAWRQLEAFDLPSTPVDIIYEYDPLSWRNGDAEQGRTDGEAYGRWSGFGDFHPGDLSGGEEDSAAMVTYTIDDIHGPALRLYPRYQEVANGSTFTLEVILEEVENVFAVLVALAFDTAKLQVTQIGVYEDGTSLLKQNGGVVIPFSAYDNGSGTAKIEVAIATGVPPGVSGTGPIALVTFRAMQAGQAFIIIHQTSALRDPENVNITIAETTRAVVEVR